MDRPEVGAREWSSQAAVVGAMVRQSREARQMGLKEVARLSGLTRVRLRALERGERQPGWSVLVRLACVFYPDNDVLALRAARRLARAAGPSLQPSEVLPDDERVRRLCGQGSLV